MINNIKITVLGTGTSVGIPALGQLGWGKCDPSNPKNKRQRCAVLIQSKNTTILVDAGPDIKNQLIEHNIQKLDAVLITHRHSDHVSGLDELRPFYFYNREKIKIFTNKETSSFHNPCSLSKAYPIITLEMRGHSRRIINFNRGSCFSYIN